MIVFRVEFFSGFFVLKSVGDVSEVPQIIAHSEVHSEMLS